MSGVYSLEDAETSPNLWTDGVVKSAGSHFNATTRSEGLIPGSDQKMGIWVFLLKHYLTRSDSLLSHRALRV